MQVREEIDTEVDVGLSDGSRGFGFSLTVCMVMESDVSGFIRDFGSYGSGVNFS